MTKSRLTRRVPPRLAVHRVTPWLRDPSALWTRVRNGARPKQLATTAPYSLELFGNIIENFKSLGGVFIPFDHKKRLRTPALVMRHDIDTDVCVQRSIALLAVDRKCGVVPTVFLRADEIEYSLEDPGAIDLVAYCNRYAIPLGLHTTCYVSSAGFETALEAELRRFEDATGTAPSFLTLHGMGAFEAASRRRFVRQMPGLMRHFGLDFSDASPRFRRYSHAFEDCHTDPAGDRFIYSDFVDPMRYLRPAKKYLVLTHPCYWSSERP